MVIIKIDECVKTLILCIIYFSIRICYNYSVEVYMARLTRTQKYAELRDQLENGREIEIKSDALNKFEDKLEQLNIDSVNVKEEVTEAPKEESSELPLEEVNTEVNEEAVIEEEPTEEVVEEPTKDVSLEAAEEVVLEVPASEEPKEEVNDDYVPFDFDEPVSDTETVEEETVDENLVEEPVIEETPKEEPVVEETPVETETSENEETSSESYIDNDEPIDLLSSLLNDFEEVKPIVETPETVNEEADVPAENEEAEPASEVLEESAEEVVTTEETKNDEPVDLLDSLLSDLDSITPVVENNDEESETIDVQKTPVETVTEEVEEETPVLEEVNEPSEEETAPETDEEPVVLEPVVSKEDAEVIDNQYLEECLNEVNEYNKSKGLMTADEVPSTILNEIRGINTQEMPVVNENTEDELSNTVTLEIKKILSELEAEDNKEEFTHEVEAQMPPTVEEELPKEVSDMLKSYMNSEENKTSSNLEETMLVENMSDIKEEIKAVKESVANEATLDSTLLNETMPLEVAGDTTVVRKAHDDEEDDEDEERGPNRILNFILISLIVVLLLILGFIGYLILVAQGII